MLGQFTRKNESDRGLDFTRADGGSLVVGSESGCLFSDTFKDVIDKAVHDGHGLVGDTSVRVDLLEDLVDVGVEGFLSGLSLSLDGGGFLCLFSSLGRCLSGRFLSSSRSHFNRL